MWEEWVLDATNYDGRKCFCPIEENGDIVLGMNVISEKCPGKFVGIFHLDGQEAADRWAEDNRSIIDEIAAQKPGAGQA